LAASSTSPVMNHPRREHLRAGCKPVRRLIEDTMPRESKWSFRNTCTPDDNLNVPSQGYLKSLAFGRRDDLSCRRRPASVFACAARPTKTWIPAPDRVRGRLYAGMTNGRLGYQLTNSELLSSRARIVQFPRTLRLSVFAGDIPIPYANSAFFAANSPNPTNATGVQ
jgi:hypothetical protein